MHLTNPPQVDQVDSDVLFDLDNGNPGNAVPQEEGGWGPLKLGLPPRCQPFPFEVFPDTLRAYCEEVGGSMSAPLDYVGGAMLACASAAIGNSLRIRLKADWSEPCPIYMQLVGGPGTTKSPVAAAVGRPLDDAEDEYRREWVAECDIHREQQRQREEGAEPLSPPVRRRLVVRDTTREALVLILEENPRGLLQVFDEGTALIKSMNEYKTSGGSDREFYLATWSCAPYGMDRKGKGKGSMDSIYARRPFITILANLTPDSLDVLMDKEKRSDGFLDRFLFAFPDETPDQRWSKETVSRVAAVAWEKTIRDLLSLEMVDHPDGPAPMDVELTQAAEARWIEWYNVQSREVVGADASRLAGMLSKSRRMAARLALILRALRWASGSTTHQKPSYVDVEDVEGAIKLIDYFVSTYLKVDYIIHKGAGSPAARAVLGWIRRNRREDFREADVLDHVRWLKSDRSGFSLALMELSEANAIRVKPVRDEPGKRGRKPSPSFEVNPAVLTSPINSRNSEID